MQNDRPSSTLRRFFTGLTENTFLIQLGVADPPLVDYLSDMLMRFVRLDAVFKVRNLTGRPLTEIGQMLVEAKDRIGDARREVHRHIGDYTLFRAGLYPESLRKTRGALDFDQFTDYCAHGKRAYLVASSIEVDEETEAPGDLLQRLSHQFEMCAYGLREVRRQWELREGDDDVRPFLIN